MNQCSIQRNGVVTSREELQNTSSGAVFSPAYPNRRESVVCPKPRRVAVLIGAVDDSPSSIRRHLSNQGSARDSQAGSELLDIILSKGGNGSGTNSNTQVGLSPPFFCGSPPSRVSNPLIQDARFKEEKILPTIASGYPLPSSPALPQTVTPSSASARMGGCVRGNFGNSPVVRIEGFNCLDRDHSRNCSIPALG